LNTRILHNFCLKIDYIFTEFISEFIKTTPSTVNI